MADTPTPEAQKVSHEIWDDYITGIAEGKFSERVAAREAIALALDRFAAARVEAERERCLDLLEEWREAMKAVGQLHSLQYMLNEIKNGNLPEKAAP